MRRIEPGKNPSPDAVPGPLLDTVDLSAYYGHIQATWGLSLDVRRDTVTGLLGSNGAGKTAVMKAIAGLIPYTGRVRLNGEDIDHLPPHKRVELGIALVPEGRKLFPYLSVKENLEVGAFTRRGRKVMHSTMGWYLDLFPVLESRKSQAAGSLSGGEQQMLAIGRGLMSRPLVLMLDEPSLGLAPLMAGRVFEMIESIHRENISVFLVEQNVRHTLELADSAYVLENGRITLQGSGSELLQNEYIRQAYLGL